ncbi:thiamine pyrophosphokinase [Kwoniella newhampshirensis]|uniref:Thiamine pyrophosphokinase n=1 Tax=Kwoniella newhampshirensis TaxID=1651941 RepID=A0AAW0YPV8_9TREE
MTTIWTCAELLRGESSRRYALIIVNQPIRKDVLDRVWNAAQMRLCADGGGNRLYNVDKSYLPDMIKGDLDSLRPDVREYYESRGVPVKHDSDEYSTDLMKCIVEVPEDVALVLLGGLSGRVDQTVHTMSLLHKLERDIFVLSEESMAWLLRKVHWDTSLLGNLSTSNHLLPEHEVIRIETSKSVLWTVEIRPL